MQDIFHKEIFTYFILFDWSVKKIKYVYKIYKQKFSSIIDILKI